MGEVFRPLICESLLEQPLSKSSWGKSTIVSGDCLTRQYPPVHGATVRFGNNCYLRPCCFRPSMLSIRPRHLAATLAREFIVHIRQRDFSDWLHGFQIQLCGHYEVRRRWRYFYYSCRVILSVLYAFGKLPMTCVVFETSRLSPDYSRRVGEACVNC